MSAASPELEPRRAAELLGRIEKNIHRVIVGKDRVVRLAAAGLVAGGHVLLQDLPGTGKTMLARALATSVGGAFRRIQCTPDLLPSDITGSSIFNQKDASFEFVAGPIFANIVLADEVNRATPRTQSALLEAMGEGQVTIEGVTRMLEKPFFVIATQNPTEFHGTYPLPESQLDRFILAAEMGPPTDAEAIEILARREHGPHRRARVGGEPRRRSRASGRMPAGGVGARDPRLHRVLARCDPYSSRGLASRQHAFRRLPAAGRAGVGSVRGAGLRASRRRQAARHARAGAPARHERTCSG